MNNVEYTIDIIKNNPYVIARDVGFRDVRLFPHNEWMREIITGNSDYTLLAHRGSYKSSVLSVCIALIMVVKPDSNIIFLRKADNDIAEMIRMVKKALESEALQSISKILYRRPIEFREATASAITTNLYISASGASQLLGIGLKASITGKHADIVITDDICNISDRISKAERDRTKLQYQELQNIRNRGGRIINTGTRWHADDVFSLVDETHVYDYHATGLISDEKIQEIRNKMTPSLFACNYELRIIASEDVIFQPLDASHFGLSPSLVEQGIMHVDSGFYGEDYTAMTVCKKHDGKYYVMLKMWRKHVEDCYPDIINAYRRFMSGKCYMESNADKGMVARDLRQAGMKMVTYAESMNKYVKIVTYLKSIWSDVYFVEGTDMDAVQQIYDYNDEAEHDDAPDSLASMARILYNKRETGGSAAYSMFL